MGASVALFSSADNRRALFGPNSVAGRRSDVAGAGAGANDDLNLYAKRVQDFEDSVQRGIVQSTRRYLLTLVGWVCIYYMPNQQRHSLDTKLGGTRYMTNQQRTILILGG